MTNILTNAPKNTTYLLKSQIFAKRGPFDTQKICCTLKTQTFLGKNSSFCGKNSSLLASKLNEPAVTNYTRHHKRVKKACIKYVRRLLLTYEKNLKVKKLKLSSLKPQIFQHKKVKFYT